MFVTLSNLTKGHNMAILQLVMAAENMEVLKSLHDKRVPQVCIDGSPL